MAKKAQLTFTGLDSDTSARFMKEGSYRDALNIHIGSSEDDGMFSVENVKGNSLVSYSLPSGTNNIIGSHEDIANRCVYFFLFNERTLNIVSTDGINVTTDVNHGLIYTDLATISGAGSRTDILGDWIVYPTGNTTFQVLNKLTYVSPYTLNTIALTGTSGASGTVKAYSHSILKYDSFTNTISLVWKHSRLNFKKDYLITGTALLNGVLHWTDGYNPPRSLDQSVLARVVAEGNFFNETIIDFIKLPPSNPPTVVGKWVNSSGTVVPYSTNKKEKNKMNDKSYQFIYRYVYRDNTRSVWSPVSATIATGYAEARINKIEVTFEFPPFFGTNVFGVGIVTAIEIAFRESILSDFKFIDKIIENTGSAYNFYNDSAYSSVDQAETSKPFDGVPKVSGSLTAVQNRVFMGDCTEGFDVKKGTFGVTAIDYDGLGTYMGIDGNPVYEAKNIITWKIFEAYDIGIVFYDRAERKSGVYKLFSADIPTDPIGFQVYVPKFTLTGIPPIWATKFRIVRTDLQGKSFFVQGYMSIVSRNEYITLILFNNLNGQLSYSAEKGDILEVEGVQYPIIQNTADLLGNPVIAVRGFIPLDGSTMRLYKCEIFTPSVLKGKVYYEIPKTFYIKDPGTDKRTFTGTNGLQIKLKDIVSGDVYSRNLNDSLAYHSRIVIRIKDSKYNSNTIFYCSILGLPISGGSNTPGNLLSELQVAQNMVASINASALFRAFIFFNGSTYDPSIDALGKVSGEARIILFDVRKGNKGSIIPIFPSLSYVGIGVSFFPNSLVGRNSAQAFMEQNDVYSMCANDKDLTWEKNIGRAGLILNDDEKEIRRETLIRFGGKFITDTAINYVNSVDSEDQEPLSNSGKIRKLIAASNNQAEGSVLLAVQDAEINSIYIGQQVMKNATGGQNIIASDKVIGSVNPLQKSIGSINPESIVQQNGLVYGFDALKGVVWRYGQDGLNLLSDLGMKSFFYKRSKYLLSLASFKCFGGIDPFHNEYILTIPNTDSEKTTIAWSENLNRWTSFMSYIGEFYQKINTDFLSFINGQTYLHRSNALYNNFYGVQYTSKIKAVCNEEPDNTKVIQVIEQKATSPWDCIEIATPEGQNSELLGVYDLQNPDTYPQDFRKYDNTTYSANVMRDKNTPNMLASDYPLLNGDVMRSDTFTILMQNEKTTKENLDIVNIKYQDSHKKS